MAYLVTGAAGFIGEAELLKFLEDKPEGLEVVLQVGIGSNQMDSRCFQPLVDCGCQVRQGQELLRFDLEAMQQAGILTATPLVVNRSPQQVHPLALGNLEAGSALLEVTL